MKRTLWLEFIRMTAISCGLYAVLFLLLWAVEYVCPSLHGTLLQWHDPAFLVGIPASVLGTGYVLTVRNPLNYYGFYGGIVMSVLLSCQFGLQGSWDMVVLYMCVFIPFLIRSIAVWRRGVTDPSEGNESQTPSFLSGRYALYTLSAAAVIVAVDWFFSRNVLNALMIASSILANFWMIYKKNDAWIWWLVYSASGIILFALLGNIFSVVLFVVMLVVNAGGQWAWLKATKPDDFGWAGCCKCKR